jgi:hypothetical protein
MDLPRALATITLFVTVSPALLPVPGSRPSTLPGADLSPSPLDSTRGDPEALEGSNGRFAAPGASATVQPVRGEERYQGFDVARLAEATARLGAFRTQHGEAKGNEAFAAWLKSEGLSRAGYDSAYASWWERFRADPTGQLEARFHRINSEWVQKLNFGDAKDRRLDTREGVTLETYAKIAVALTRLPGADLKKVLNENGVKYVGELGLKNSDAKMTAQRALNRAEARLATLQASFAPIKDKAVPERITLRTRIDEYTSAVRDLRAILALW